MTASQPPLPRRSPSADVEEEEEDEDYEYGPDDEEEEEVDGEYEDDEDLSDADPETLLEYLNAAEELAQDEAELNGEDRERLLHTATGEQNGDDNNIRNRDGQNLPAAILTTDDGEGGQTQMTLTRVDLMRLLNQANFARVVYNRPGDDEEDSEHTRGYGGFRSRRSRRPRSSGDRFPQVPSEAGRQLMESGNFGTNERSDGNIERKKKLASRIMRRELGLGSPGGQRSINRLAAQNMIPSSNADTIIHYDHRCYSGQFSDDGNFFFSCSQDFKVRMYDTSNPFDWKYYKTVIYPYGQWTITDASLSPDNRFLAYSSIKSTVCLAATDPDDNADPVELDFADYGAGNARNRRGRFGYGPGHFGIWSIRFSGDGRELVAGTSDNSVYAYDIETRRTILRITGHDDDVNAVCFGDKLSPHLLYSGADDTMLKVWDRRSMSDNREAGVFFGHREGLTYVDSKGDGRYVLSNGKDQTMKLWDLRKMMSTERAANVDPTRYTSGFDYRFQEYDEEDFEPHPHDCSVVTFRGHKVLKTLIRCHFSPPGSTDSRYVYSGSEDGSVYIYNLDATEAGRVNVTRATQNTRPRGDDDYNMMAYYSNDPRRSGAWKTCVRDVSWHPYAPVIAATSWNGYGMHHGTCTVHTWNDGLDEDEAEDEAEMKMGRRLDARLQHDPNLYEESAPRPRAVVRPTRSRRAMDQGDDD